MTSNWAAASDARLRVEDIDWGSTDGEDMFNANADDLLIADPRAVRRAETAPMVLTIMNTDGSLCVGNIEEVINPDEEYRYTEEYHRLYYSKNPRDPRMMPPLTRRRHHLVRKLHAPGVFAAAGGESGSDVANGAVGDRAEVAAAATVAAVRAATPEPAETLSGPALVKLYVDSFRPDWDYGKIKSNVCSFSKDQDGSRLVQRLLEKPENIVAIFEEVIGSFGELATDVFGNYVLQKMFDVVPKAENDPIASSAIKEAKMLERLTGKVRGHLLEYSSQTYGCRVMQKAVEHMRATDRDVIVHELEGHIVDSVLDQNANHVVQKVIEVSPAKSQFVVDAFMPSLGELACHAYGCRVLQRTFEKCHDVEGVNIRPLMEAVLARVNEFTVHQYGNYVVQHAMLNAPDDLRHRFVVQLTPQLYALSCSKFASNVAERIVTTATDEERDNIIRELKKPLSDSQGGNYLVNMMQDTYANYVVQRFFEAVSATQRERISELVQPYIGSINQSVYGRHLLRKMVSNNILTNSFLLGHGIDVSGPDYGGNSNNNGHRGGNAGGDRNGHNGRGGNRNGNGGNGPNYGGNRNGHNNGGSHRGGPGMGGNGRNGRSGGRGGGNGQQHHGNSNNSGNNGAPQQGGSANGLLVFSQPQQQQVFAAQQQFPPQQPAMSGYMPMPQQYPYGANPYGVQQPQQPQAFMHPTAGTQLYPQQPFMPQMAPNGFGGFPVVQQPQPQPQGNYTLQYGAPLQNTPPPQSLQPQATAAAQQQQAVPRRNGEQSPQAFVNGGFNNGMSQGSGSFQSTPQLQAGLPSAGPKGGISLDPAMKGGRGGKLDGSGSGYVNAMGGADKGLVAASAAAPLGKAGAAGSAQQQQRAGFGSQRAPVHQASF